MRLRVALAGICFVAGLAPLQAQDEPAPSKTLATGKGVEITTTRCVLCHDATHITRTKLSRGEWEFNIKNMIERGAPIAPAEIAPILEYLATYYNRDSAPPPPSLPETAASSGDALTQLLSANACMACHQIDKRVVGPSFKEVAAKYAGDAAATALLTNKIKAGGSGNWGAVPMPPNAGLSDAELAQLAAWVLRQNN